MKKLNSAIAVIMIFVLSLCFAACGEGLPTPENLRYSENTIVWDEVENARLYRLSIRNTDSGEEQEDTTRSNSYSVSALPEGNYEIRVRAVGGSRNSLESAWSEKLLFEKLPGSGLVFRAINNNNEFEILRGSAVEGDVVLPDEYQGKPVTQIAAGAFRANGKLTGVTIGKNITSIGSNAFYQCPRLAKVEFGENVVSIGEAAFQGCSGLTGITLPDSLLVVPDFLFAYCINLQEVNFGSGNLYIGASAFYGTALKDVTLPDGLAYVGEYAFSTSNSTALETVSFGKIQTVDQYAFLGCTSLRELTFREETENFLIGPHAFAGCTALGQVTFPEGLYEISDSAFEGDTALSYVDLPADMTRIGAGAFNGTELVRRQEESGSYHGFLYADGWLLGVTDETRENLTEVLAADSAAYFPDDVVGFASQALQNCTNLRTFYVPRSLKRMNDYAFYGCPNLYAFICPDNSALEVIGYAAFSYCTTLSNINLSRSSLKEIEQYAFYGCTNVSNPQRDPHMLIPSTVERVGALAFGGTALADENNIPAENNGIVYAGNWVVGYASIAQSDVTLRSGVEGVSDYAFHDCETLTSITGFGNNTLLGNGAFYGCKNLTSITLPRGLKKISNDLFYGCGSLVSVAGSEGLPTGITEIGDRAFMFCAMLGALDLSVTKVTSIGTLAFYYCNNLRDVNLGSSLETIGDYAFYYCSMSTLILPSTVRSVGQRAFGYCVFLSEVDLGNGIETIGPFAFRNCASLRELYIPASVKTIGQYAFYLSGLNSVTLNEGLETIGACAFCTTHLSIVVLPASVRYIGDYAFRECDSLSLVYMLGEPEYVGAHAFFNCEYATIYSAAGTQVHESWDPTWNSSHRPAIWGCEIVDGIVVSVTLGEGSITDGYARYGMRPPFSTGERFLGWSLDPENEEDLLTTGDLRDLPAGTTVYAMYAPF